MMRFEDRHRLHFNQKIGPAQDRLNARGCRERFETLIPEEFSSNLIEGSVVAFDVAKVAGGPNNILPGRTLGLEQRGDVLVGSPGLGAEIALMNRAAVLVYTSRPGNQKDGQTLDVQAQAP